MNNFEWMERALCAYTDPGLFIADISGASSTGAKRICAACPVVPECLDYAVRRNIRDGIYGGLTEDERRPLCGREPRNQVRCDKCTAWVKRGQLRRHNRVEHEIAS